MNRCYFNGTVKRCVNGCLKPLSDFYPHSGRTKKGKIKDKNLSCYYRPYCKTCHNQINIRKVLEKKIKEYPNSFWECDNCDHIVSVSRKFCSKCKAERIKK